MLFITHISIALLSVLYAGFVLVSPSMQKLYINYVMIGLTLLSGTILTVRDHINILSVCTTGLVYIGIMLTASVFIRRRLAAVAQKN